MPFGYGPDSIAAVIHSSEPKPVSARRGQYLFEYDTGDVYRWVGDEKRNGSWQQVGKSGAALAAFGDDNLDAFGRLQVSNPVALFTNKNIHSKHKGAWEERTGGGGTITHNAQTASVRLTVPGTAGAYAIRQTIRYFPYVPGKSHAPQQTGTFAPAQENLFQAIGYFDGPAGAATTYGNGIYFCYDGLIPTLKIRTDTSGTGYTEDESFPQSDWNIDKLDGKGPSGITLDLTKSQIITPPFQWLGVGTVTWHLGINGRKIAIHKSNHSNLTSGVYMRTPSLPLRYEIRNLGATTGATLEEICSEVSSDGGYILSGTEYSVETGKYDVGGPMANLRTISVVGDAPILILRLKPTHGGVLNRQTLRYLGSSFFAAGDPVRFVVAHIHEPASIDANWLDVDLNNDIGAEFAYENAARTGNPVITGGMIHYFAPTVASTGPAAKGGSQNDRSELIDEHAYASNNFEATNSQCLAIYASASAAATGYAGMDFSILE